VKLDVRKGADIVTALTVQLIGLIVQLFYGVDTLLPRSVFDVCG
jgi:hypothetical protein